MIHLAAGTRNIPAANTCALKSLRDDFAVSALTKAQQIVWAVAIRSGLEIFPTIVGRHNNVRMLTLNECIERVRSLLDSADGVILSQPPISLLVPDIFNAFMRVLMATPLVNAGHLILSHSSPFSLTCVSYKTNGRPNVRGAAYPFIVSEQKANVKESPCAFAVDHE
jgi:hypothetical protein